MHRAIVPTTAVADPAGVNMAGQDFTTSAVTVVVRSGDMTAARIADTTGAMADRGAATAAMIVAMVAARVEANTAAIIVALSGTTIAAMDAATSAKPD